MPDLLNNAVWLVNCIIGNIVGNIFVEIVENLVEIRVLPYM